ncbi:hypothetical protein [Flavobacterium sp.]
MLVHYLKLHLQTTIRIARFFGNVKKIPSLTVICFLTFLAHCSLNAQCSSPPGNPAIFGDNVWNAYVYDNSDLSLATAVYSGYYTQGTLGFDTTNVWTQGSSPTNGEGWSGCAVDSDAFTYVYKRKGFPCGSYTITFTGWDDAAVVFIDGIEQWNCTNGSEAGDCDGYIGEIILNEDSEIEVRVREDGGNSFASLNLVNNTPTITGIISPSGDTTICAGTRPGAISLSGYTGGVIKWQVADDAAFTIGVTDIVSTSDELTSAEMGIINTTHYYRAVVQNGSCTPAYSTSIQITVPEAVTFSGGSWDGILTDKSPMIIEDDMTLIDDLEVCSCLVKNGKILTIASDVNLTTATSITVETGSQLIVEDGGSILQLDDTAINSGNITVKRNSQPMKLYDYTYWSSPVQNNTLFQLSPLTLSDKYYRFSPIIGNWVSIPGGLEVMEPGRGYIVRAPQGWSVTNASLGIYNAQFNGTPNNGVVSAAIQKGIGTFNLIGNPYPSAIDIDLFLTDPANDGIVNGTVYLWTHNTAISSTMSGNWNYTVDDYAKYNLTGGVNTASAAITGGAIPNGKISSGQGFFIEAATALPNGTYAATFRNSMRVGGNNSQFYRARQPEVATSSVAEKSRLWINITNDQGAYNQILIGYVTGATNGFDTLFDGKPMQSSNVLSMYSFIGNDMCSIQGRALPFTENDVVPLGYNSTIAGNFTITINSVDGIFDSQDVYLLDRMNNVEHDLKAAPYSFTSAIGSFNNRFEIRYRRNLLGTPDFNQHRLLLTTKNSQLEIEASSPIQSVELFDLLGRKIYKSNNINVPNFVTPVLPFTNQLLIARIKFTDFEIDRKIILK